MPENQQSPATFQRRDVEIITRERLYKGFFSLIKYRFRHRLFSGALSKVIEREVFERGHAAAVLPYDAQRDEVVLVEQIRIPAYDSSQTPWLLEIVAGMIGAGETGEQVARREAMEEAGLTLGRIKPVIDYLSSPGGSSERIAVMVGETDATQAKGCHGLDEENEDILVRVVSREQAYQWVEQGMIDNAATVIALQWLELHHRRLTEEWKAT
ncbi:ADP-ribose diphosphatase [Tatumella saanichensis]|uniref:ADP-ribose diphosphatase n=1 Tax=Tatumella saanichensis TaxID=480813 RepID=UPI0004A3432D|nr:ADP-ribose diphosphatase [Tatumella saanichensis]